MGISDTTKQNHLMETEEMTDNVSKSQRSRIMASIHSENTRPEQLVHKALREAAIEFRSNVKDLPGRPDILLTGFRTIVFVHGCFWHGHRCRRARTPTTNASYWREKIRRNMMRDQVNQQTLRKAGWRVVIVWECRANTDIDRLIRRLRTENEDSGSGFRTVPARPLFS